MRSYGATSSRPVLVPPIRSSRRFSIVSTIQSCPGWALDSEGHTELGLVHVVETDDADVGRHAHPAVRDPCDIGHVRRWLSASLALESLPACTATR